MNGKRKRYEMKSAISLTNMHLDSCIYLCTYLFCFCPPLSHSLSHILSFSLYLSLSLSLSFSLSLSHSLFDFIRLCLTLSFIHSLTSYTYALFLSYSYFHISNSNSSLFIHFPPFSFSLFVSLRRFQ